jgi:hypothetical protein
VVLDLTSELKLKTKITFVWREKLYETDAENLGADIILLSHLGRRLVITVVPGVCPPRIASIRESKPDEIDILDRGVKSEWAYFIRNVPTRERMWYDCAEGLRDALSEGLRIADLELYRRVAMQQKEQLKEFYINGMVHLICTGDVIAAELFDQTPKDLMPDIPYIVECEEFERTLQARAEERQIKCIGRCFAPWYDTIEGLTSCLTSLERFYGAVNERRRAAERGEQLTSYYVYGRFLLHKDGAFGIAKEHPLCEDMAKDTPRVVNAEEYDLFLKVRGLDRRVWYSGAQFLSEELRCRFCRQGWFVSNSHDYKYKLGTEEMPLDDFVGKTLREVKAKLEQGRSSNLGLDHYRWLAHDHPVRNDECIDLALVDFRVPSIKVNEEGFRPDVRRETDDYAIRPGDVARFDVWRYYHEECWRRQLWKDCQDEILESFLAAGFKKVEIFPDKLKLNDPKNELPEFCVVADGDFMKIGWTDGEGIKIEWEVSPGDRVLDWFKDEEIRKEEGCVYAKNRDTAKEYLKRIKKAFTCCLNIG